jgi:hypothetical protein
MISGSHTVCANSPQRHRILYAVLRADHLDQHSSAVSRAGGAAKSSPI